MYSTIQLRPCKCGCGKNQTFNCSGYFYAHMPEELKEAKGTKKALQQKNKNTRNSIAVKLRRDSRPIDELSGLTVKEIWFQGRRKEMTGECACGCGLPSSMDSDKHFRSSICHILPQKNFPSVQFHPLNWIEMNFWEGHHTNFDGRGSDRWPQLACWEIIVERFLIIYPLTLPEERKHIPKVLRQFI